MKNIYNFLVELCVNNNREWFDENRNRYKTVKVEFENIVKKLISEVSQFDSSVANLKPKDCIFRINRDTRFSHDKTPYKTNFGGFLVPDGKKCAKAGYYLHIEPDNSFVAGGIYLPPTPELTLIRQHIFDNIDEFKSIIYDAQFVKTFGELDAEKLKNPPRGFNKDFVDIELLKFKSYTILVKQTDEQILNDSFIDQTINYFKLMKDFNTFLNIPLR